MLRFADRARAAVESIRPATEHPERAEGIARRLTQLPLLPVAGLACVLSVVTAVRLLVDLVGAERVDAWTEPLSVVVVALALGVLSGSGSLHAVRVATLAWRIPRVLATEVRVSVYEPGPIDSFSRLRRRWPSVLLQLVISRAVAS